jgi:hypothetical protein
MRLTTLPPSCADCLEIPGASNSWNTRGLSRPVTEQLYPLITLTKFRSGRDKTKNDTYMQQTYSVRKTRAAPCLISYCISANNGSLTCYWEKLPERGL